MTFGEYVERARSRCTEVLLKTIAEQKATGRNIMVEPAPRNSSGEILSDPNGLKLLLRYDFAYLDETETWRTKNAESVTISMQEPVFASWENCLAIEIRRLCWDHMELELSPLTSQDFEPLRQWFLRWFDPEDSHPARPDGLYGVVHFLSDPEWDRDTARLFVDLGSAPKEALAEFLDQALRMGVKKCVIG